MRLWSLHPRYLDAKGLVALWREGLLAQKVLAGQTRGYRQHPQLQRFSSRPDSCAAIATYLEGVLQEAQRRGYHFDAKKIGCPATGARLTVTRGQLVYELDHLRAKLAQRDPGALQRISGLEMPEPHPSFEVLDGGVEKWEIVRPMGMAAAGMV